MSWVLNAGATVLYSDCIITVTDGDCFTKYTFLPDILCASTYLLPKVQYFVQENER